MIRKTYARRRHRDGFALLMAVIFIALAAMMLAGLARKSMDLAMRSAELHDELGVRWGTLTLQRAIAHQATPILNRYLEGQGIRPAEGLPLEFAIRVDQTEYRLVIDDENRKLNLSRLFTRLGRKGLQEQMEHLGLTVAAAHLPVTLADQKIQIESWGQIFTPDSIPARQNPADWMRERTGSITLWGSGKVNINRAPDKVIEAACQGVATPVVIGRLLALRSNEPELDLKTLLDRLKLERPRRARLEGCLDEKSDCFSVWLSVVTSRQRRTQLLVFDQSEKRLASFRW